MTETTDQTKAERTIAKVAKAHVKLAASAETLTDSAHDQTDSADRRTVLAADRTVLAAERTYAAWVRTGLAALAAGIGARALLDHVVPGWMTMATASMLILFSAFSFGAAVWREIVPRYSPPRPEVRKLPSWILLSINGFLILVSLTALIGLWLS